MTRTALAVAASLLALAACARSSQAAPPPEASPGAGKPTAPVSVGAELSTGAARVTVRFEADAKDVRIAVFGADGLAVTSAAEPVAKGAFARGEAAALDVTFTPGPGRSRLAVSVTGKFHGAGKRTRTATFAVGEPTPEQLRGEGAVVEGADGEKVRVVVPGK
jgi:hypothetical protein